MGYDRVITFRPDSSSNWNTNNPVLAKGEGAVETDTGMIKVGDGVTVYSSLPYTTPTIRVKYNITDSTDVTVNLPDATNEVVERTYFRTGSGSGKVLFSTTSSQLINGLSASSWELENEEKIVLFPYSGNWYVKEYGGYDEDGNVIIKPVSGESIISDGAHEIDGRLTVKRDDDNGNISQAVIIESDSYPSKRLYIGYNVTHNQAVLQSIDEGTAYQDIALNPNGGWVNIGSLGIDRFSFAKTTSPPSRRGITWFDDPDGRVVIWAHDWQTTPFIEMRNSRDSNVRFKFRIDTGNGYCDGSWSGGGADYAEWIEADTEDIPKNVVIGLNLKTQRARKWEKGDIVLGVHSSNPGFIGNNIEDLTKNERKDGKKYVLTAILGQVIIEDAVIEKNGVVYTTDMQQLGYKLRNGKVYLRMK